MSQDLMSTNIYACRGVIAVTGTCLEQMQPKGFDRICRKADQVYTLCLEQNHVNMAITKLTAILSTGQVDKIIFATVDRSPHCTQMHYIMHEIRRTLTNDIPTEHYVVKENQLAAVSEEAIELSKTLSLLTEITQDDHKNS